MPVCVYSGDGDSDIEESRKQKDAPKPHEQNDLHRPISEEVVAVLEALYKRGMTGWSKKHQGDIETAVKSTGLCRSQVEVCLNCHITRIASNTNASFQTKNWIRRRNMKRHAGEEADQGMLHIKRVRLTPWQQYLDVL